MVVRSSFVTNSSSSSFVCLSINSKEIVDILKEFEDELSELFEFGGVNFCGDSQVEIYIDEGYAEPPVDKNDILHAFAGLLDYNYYEEYCYAEEDDEELDMSQFSEVVQKLIANKDEIMQNLKYFKMSLGHCGWQGDDDTRFEEDWYEEDTLQYIKESIAEEKGCEIDEITSEDFCEYVCDKMNTEEQVFEYDGETDTINTYRTTDLE